MEEIESGMGGVLSSNLHDQPSARTSAAAAAARPGPTTAPTKSAVALMADEMINSLKQESEIKSKRGVIVYNKEFGPNHILGEVVIAPEHTVDEMMAMIVSELGVKPGFNIKKKNIPITKNQRNRLAIEFFRTAEDFAVVF